MIKNEIKAFLTAVMFYTRLPVPFLFEHHPEYLNRGTTWLTFIGWIVGGVSALIFLAAQMLFPATVAILFSMVATILLTGAFHEDGFADMCDGFGGGYGKEQILNIMKDSRLGTYGGAGLILMLLIKFSVLSNIDARLIPLAMLAGHAFSRWAPVWLIKVGKYVQRTDVKAKPVAEGIGWPRLIFSGVFAIIPLFFLPEWSIFWVIPVTAAGIVFFFRYLKKHIGGYTGDTLGASQQLAEITFYLVMLAAHNG